MLELDFEEIFEISINSPKEFFDHLAEQVVWSKKYETALRNKNDNFPDWFSGGELNMSYNCLDRQVEDGHGDNIAVIFDSPITKTIKRFTYKEILKNVELTAGILTQKCGVKRGDVVFFFMPGIPECLFGMLACTRIGAIYSASFPALSVSALARRIKELKPKVVVTANVGFRNMEEIKYKERIDIAILQSGLSVAFCMVFNRHNFSSANMTSGRDIDWLTEMNNVHPEKAIPLESNHPMFIPYTSGSTGNPKGIVMRTAGCVIYNKYLMPHLINIQSGFAIWPICDFGWISGQTVGSYGPLMNMNPFVLFEGCLVPSEFYRIVNIHKINSILSGATSIRIVRELSKDFNYNDIDKHLKKVYLGGEKVEDGLKTWIRKTLKSKAVEIYGQTELCCVSNPFLSNTRDWDMNQIGFLGRSPGINFVVIDEFSGAEQVVGKQGRIVIKRPLPPWAADSFYSNQQSFAEAYFEKYPGYFDTKDIGIKGDNGSFKILSRADDYLKVSTNLIGASYVEDVCLQNRNVSEVAVVPLDHKIFGQLPFVFLVLIQNPKDTNENIIRDVLRSVQEYIGDVAQCDHAIIIPAIPKTKSGKVMKHSLTSMINGKESTIPPTIDDPNIFQQIFDSLIKYGYSGKLPSDE